MSVGPTIASQLQEVAIEHDRTLAPLNDELKLLESGLDSMGLAIVVIRLADLLGIDPFNSGAAVEFPLTFGDFFRVYETFRKVTPACRCTRSAGGPRCGRMETLQAT
jgi:hypothetical protein